MRAVGELLPTSSSAWPPWKVAALALLAVGEAFVLVRLVRGGRLAQPGEIA